jgi:hypothetical protein
MSVNRELAKSNQYDHTNQKKTYSIHLADSEA